MRKKIIGILVAGLFILTSYSVIGINNDNNSIPIISINNRRKIMNKCDVEIIDQEQTYTFGRGQGVSGNGLLAQSFVPTLDIISKVQLLMFKSQDSHPDYITISIRDDLNGDDLTSASIIADNVTGNNIQKWIEFDFEDISINSGEVYYIIWRQYGGGGSDYVYWNYGPNNPYEQGDAWMKINGWNMFNPPDQNNPDFCFKTYNVIENNPPETPTISGPSSGKAGEKQNYVFSSVDSEGNDIYFRIKWGDDQNINWIGPYTSGKEVTFGHTWSEEGTYEIQVKAKDIYEEESDWATLEVSMPKNKPAINTPFIRFLEGHPHMFPLLQKLLRL